MNGNKKAGQTEEVKAGARHSAADMKLIASIKENAQAIISTATELGADDGPAPEQADAEQPDDGAQDDAPQKTVKAEVSKTEDGVEYPSSAYLVVEDPKEPSTWHLRVKDDKGKPDHNLMGAAWASLHGGYRGNKYDGPNKQDAIEKLKKIYDAEKMPYPDEKSANVKRSLVIKAKTDDTLTIGGYGVVFGGVDLSGDTFTAKTDFWLDKLPGERPLLYEHGFDDGLGLTVLGKTVKMEPDETGLWVEAELNRHQRYMKEVEALIEAGVLGYSSGSAGHLVRRETGEGKSILTIWPILEFSITPTPAEPRTLGVHEIRAVKSALQRDVLKTIDAAARRAAQPKAVKMLTLGEQEDAVEEAVCAALCMYFPDSAWGGMGETDADDAIMQMFVGVGVDDEDADDGPALYIYDGFAVAQVGVAYWQIPYEITGGAVVVADRNEWQLVDMNWTPAKSAPAQTQTPQEEEIEMNKEELKALLKEAAEDAVRAYRAELESAPPVKRAGVAAPNINLGRGEPRLTDEQAFRSWMTYGNDAPAEVIKAMRSRAGKVVGTDIGGDTEAKATLGESSGSGAYWVPTGLANQILLPLANMSYIRKAGANVMSNMQGYDPFNVPVLTFSGRASIGGESSQYVPDEATASQVSFIPYKMKKLAKVTEELVEDSRYDAWEMILQPDYIQSFAEGENYYLTLGTGSGQPQGVVAGATVGVTAASTSTFTADELISLFYSVDPKYRDDSSFVFMANDAVLKVIRQLKDGNGDYLWTPGFGEAPDRILGKPVIWNNSMSSALTTGQTLILAGAMRYYWVSDWPGLQVQRLTELYAETGEIGFRAFRRLDAHIMLSQAFRTLKLA